MTARWKSVLLRLFEVVFLLLPQFSFGQTVVGKFSFADDSVISRMQRDVCVLASDSMGGRPSGTEFETLAARYITTRLAEAGLEAIELPFEVQSDSAAVLKCKNILALLDRGGDSTIVIGAHYDHLGLGGQKSLEIRKKGIHPGADDNASGVGMILELARYFVAADTGRYNVAFLALSAHEIGLFGAREFVSSRLADSLKIKQYVNFDMVGRLNKTSKTARLSFCGSSFDAASAVALGKNQGLYILIDARGEVFNDYSIFCEGKLSAISLTTGLHDDYHRTGDKEVKINYDGMLSIFRFCIEVLK